jgi:hypothetical protein
LILAVVSVAIRAGSCSRPIACGLGLPVCGAALAFFFETQGGAVGRPWWCARTAFFVTALPLVVLAAGVALAGEELAAEPIMGMLTVDPAPLAGELVPLLDGVGVALAVGVGVGVGVGDGLGLWLGVLDADGEEDGAGAMVGSGVARPVLHAFPLMPPLGLGLLPLSCPPLDPDWG